MVNLALAWAERYQSVAAMLAFRSPAVGPAPESQR